MDWRGSSVYCLLHLRLCWKYVTSCTDDDLSQDVGVFGALQNEIYGSLKVSTFDESALLRDFLMLI